MTYRFIHLVLGALVASTFSLNAAYTFRDGKIVDSRLVATMPMEAHYNAGVTAMEACNWREAARQFGITASSFPLSPYGQEAAFYQGVANYQLSEYDLADQAFSEYLQAKSNPRLFEETIEFKYAIAEQFRGGARRRLLGTKQLPKWASSDSYALKIYEEVIAAVPCHELAVQSLFSKGLLHQTRREYAQSVECFQMIIRRFPKHELTPESYLMINQVYLDQSRNEFQNPDILAFAEINVRRFAQNFPREERLEQAGNDVLAIKEVYAQGLYDTGLFYERVGHPEASVLYYRHAVIQFPETQIAECSNQRICELGYDRIEVQVNEQCKELLDSGKADESASGTSADAPIKIEWQP
jgi:outer membrane protein assembly factor BamD (BamD/ComL family)